MLYIPQSIFTIKGNNLDILTFVFLTNFILYENILNLILYSISDKLIEYVKIFLAIFYLE